MNEISLHVLEGKPLQVTFCHHTGREEAGGVIQELVDEGALPAKDDREKRL
jgi:hypothetical protein